MRFTYQLAAMLSLVLIGFLTAVAPEATAGAHGGLGRPVTIKPLPEPLRLPGSAAAYRMRYTSTDAAGRPELVSGAVFIPEGTRPAPGWPVIAWAHGTVGVADPCAPSTNGRSERDIAYLSAWLRAGYAVVATDYEGLGSPGPHPYLNGTSAAHGVIDIVRASRRAGLGLGRRWLAVGQSQGAQASLFTAALAGSYGSGLDFRGAIATGLPSQWRTTATVTRAFDPASPAIPEVLLIIAGLRATHPIRPADYLTSYGEELFVKARATACYRDLVPLFAGRSVAEVFDIDATEQERLLRLMEADAEIPIKRYRVPVFVAQGTADRVVYPPAAQTTANLLRDAGTDVTFRFYQGADHNTTLQAALPDLLAWAAARMGRPS